MKTNSIRRLNLIAALGLITSLVIGCQGVPPYDSEEQERLGTMGKNFDHFTHTINEHRLKGVHAGSHDKPAFLFIHGTPGDWKAWGRFLGDSELSEKTFMLAIDRPGFGQSAPGTPVLSLETQASVILQSALKEHPGPFVIVGHSYGGPIQLEIAANFPEHVSRLIILAGAIDPVLQKERWYHHLANTWAGRVILPEPLNVSTQEMLSLPSELKRLQSQLKAIDKPVTVIQGGKDWLVPSGNAEYARKQLSGADVSVIQIADQGHFLPWKEYDLVKREILKHADSSKLTWGELPTVSNH